MSVGATGSRSLDPDTFDNKGDHGLTDPAAVSVSLKGAPPVRKASLPPPTGRALTREEVLEHCNDPIWVRLRLGFEILFWACLAGLVVTVLTLSVQHPNCKARPTLQWWQKEVFYKIYVRSFFDSDSNGEGDIKGVADKLDYLSSLGVGAIVLGSTLKSQSDGLLHDTVDFKDVSLGSLNDLQHLITEAHEQDIKVILEVVPNQSGTEHPWFLESASSNTNAKANFYIWDSGNNWVSVYNGSAWNASSSRPERFLHQFTAREPDLNLRNDQVLKEISNALTFWTQQGVDGFELSNVDFLYEDYDLRDEADADPNNYWASEHAYTRGLTQSRLAVSNWRSEAFTQAEANESISMVIASPGVGTNSSGRADFYGRHGSRHADLVSSSTLMQLTEHSTAEDVDRYVCEWMTGVGDDHWPTWSLSDYWTSRAGTRLASRARLGLMLALLLPGSAMITYGDELGMEDIKQAPVLGIDEARDLYWLSRGAMSWTESGNFSNAAPWIDYPETKNVTNVKTQEESSDSMLKLFKSLVELRKSDSFLYGRFHEAHVDKDIYSFIREFDGMDSYLIAMNWGTAASSGVNYRSTWSEVAKEGTVMATAMNNEKYAVDDEVELNDLELQPGQAVVVSWPYRIREPNEY